MARMAADEHDEPDELPCYRHPHELTALTCSTCDRPICPDCAIPAAVGIKCPDCAKQPRAALGKVPPAKFAAGVAAGTFVAFAGGTVLAVIQIPLLGVLFAYLLGMGVGEVTRRAAGGFRDHTLARIAATVSVIGLLALPALALLTGSSVNPIGIAFTLLGAVLAAGAAYNRAS